MVPTLSGIAIDSVAAFRCHRGAAHCMAVPVQVDERDATYHWALDTGPALAAEDSRGVLDDNDVILLRAADAGDASATHGLPPHRVHVALEIHDPLDGRTAFLHLVGMGSLQADIATRHVHYDPIGDRLTGHRVSLGFTDGIPQSLAVTSARGARSELLDRLKIRASASLLWGLLRFTRTEADLTTEVTGWRRGPLRIIRHQHQRVRLGWGIRSPRFSSYAMFYPDVAELPVSLRLNHPPAALFGDVRIDVVLDFVDLRGWELLLPDAAPLRIGADADPSRSAHGDIETDWFALRNDEVLLLQLLETSHSLRSTRRRLVYRETARPNPPESHPGEMPAIGYRIDQWDEVDAGTHDLRALCFALPATTDVTAFLEAHRRPLRVRVRDP